MARRGNNIGDLLGDLIAATMSATMRAIGSITHWTYRALIAFICDRAGIELHPKVEWFIAYVLTGATLVGAGVWSYLWWWPLTWFH